MTSRLHQRRVFPRRIAKGDPEHRWYRSVTMSLNHAQNWTRPDLTFLVTKTAKFMQAPGEPHVKSLKKGLRYLRGTLDLGLTYDFSHSPARTGLYGYFDASHADDVDTRRSTIAYVFFLSGCVLSWKSKLHTFVTTSTNHSELVAAAMASREAKFLWKVFGALNLQELGTHRCTSMLPIDLFTDSMGVVALSRDSVLSSATKHIEIADFFVRELVERHRHRGSRSNSFHGSRRANQTAGQDQVFQIYWSNCGLSPR